VNPTITVAKFNPTITAYLVLYIREGYDNKTFAIGRVYFLKYVEHISYNIVTRALPDINTHLSLDLQLRPLGQVHIYIRPSTRPHGITITYSLTLH